MSAPTFRDADHARYVAAQAQKRARASLLHYFEKALPFPVSGDCAAEIERIADDIIEAAVALSFVEHSR